jgi:CheY-like chemotaxis protein
MAHEIKFLLVEDSEPDAWLLSSIVERVEGAQLWLVKDGAEAIAYLQGWGEYTDRQRFPLPHIILLDWELPRVSGFHFLMWRRDRTPEDIKAIPVVIFCGAEDPVNVRQAHLWGAAHFLVKTADKSTMQRHLELLVAHCLETESWKPTRAHYQTTC